MIDMPDVATDADFAAWRSSPDRWAPAVRKIARSAGLPATVLSRFETGTNLVVDLDGQSVLKLFPPSNRPQFTSEGAALRRLAGQLSVPVPAILAEGENGGWSWLAMSKLDGVVGSAVWPVLPEADKAALLEEIGRTIAEVQAVTPGELSGLEPAWPDFIKGQIAGCMERHRRRDLGPRFLSDLQELVSAAPGVVPLHVTPVILTGEWIPENLLLSHRKGRWQLAAVIDFGDVMTGWREYDLLGPSAFMCAGHHDRVRCLFAGFGLAPDACDSAMRRRLLTLMLLHRASDLRNVAVDRWDKRIDRLSDLEDLVWPV